MPSKDTSNFIQLTLSVVLTVAGYKLQTEWLVVCWTIAGGLLLHSLLFSDWGERSLSISVRWAIVILLPPGIALAFHEQIASARMAEKVAISSGVLTPRDAFINPGKYHDDHPILAGGDSDKTITVGVPGGDVFAMNPDTINLRMVDGNVLFSTVVRDQQGNTIVQIADNHWTVSNNSQQSWDKNYDDNALEVMDGKHRVVLQVRLYKDGVRLQGEWTNGISFGETGMYEKLKGITPTLFKYPSSQHWAERSGKYGD